MHHSHSQDSHSQDSHSQDSHADAPVAIDCSTCDVRGLACGDCVVTVLLGAPPAWLDDEEQRAIGVLADSGLIPPLRLVTSAEAEGAADRHSDVPPLSTSARRAPYRVRETG